MISRIGQAGRVALPGQHARRLPGAGFRWPTAGARQLALDQLPGGLDLLLGIERVDPLSGSPRSGRRDASARRTATAWTARGCGAWIRPRPGRTRRRRSGRRRCEAGEDGLGGFGRHAAAVASPGHSCARGPGRDRQQPQADLPGAGFRVLSAVGRGRGHPFPRP